MRTLEVNRIRNRLSSLDASFPENGKEATSCLACYRDLAGMGNMMAQDVDPKDIEVYALTRSLAIHYGEDVSGLPEKLSQNTRGDIGVFVL